MFLILIIITTLFSHYTEVYTNLGTAKITFMQILFSGLFSYVYKTIGKNMCN